MQQGLGGDADGLQPPARQLAQHGKAAVLVLAARALHGAQHQVPGREDCRRQPQRLEVIRKVGGLGFPGGDDAHHPVQILLQGGIQQSPARRRQPEQGRRPRRGKAGRDLLVFRSVFQQCFVHGKPPSPLFMPLSTGWQFL